MSRLLPGHHLVGHVTVDAGQLLLVDPCYLDSYWKKEEYDGGDFNSVGPYPLSYPGACQASMAHTAGLLNAHVVDGKGVGMAAVTSTGYGDGMYPVTVEVNEEGRVTSMTVTFVADE